MDETSFPHWFYGPGWHENPEPNQRICHSSEEVPAGWKPSPRLVPKAGDKPRQECDPAPSPQKPSLEQLRRTYHKLRGKKPFAGWDEDELNRRIEELSQRSF